MVGDDFENGGKITFLESELRPRVRSFSVPGVLYWMVVRERCRRTYQGTARTDIDVFIFTMFCEIQGPFGLPCIYWRMMKVIHGLSIPLPCLRSLNKGHFMLTIPVGNLPDGQMLLVNPLVLEDLSTPVYSYDHRAFKFERFFVGRFPLFGWRNMRESAADISCVEENLTPFDDLFSGVKRT